jgi:hypothetical protein
MAAKRLLTTFGEVLLRFVAAPASVLGGLASGFPTPAHQPPDPGTPLNGPTTSEVTQPP